MDIFTQKKFLVRIVILLIVLNLFSLSLFLWRDYFHRPPPPRFNNEREGSEVLKRELNLTENQEAQIIDLRTKYFIKEKVFEALIRNERDSMNVEMFSKNTHEKTVKSLAKSIADNEYKIEMLRFEQSQELKTIYKNEQLEKFENLILEIRDFFRPDNQQADNQHKKK